MTTATINQQAAIDARGRNLVLSAGAGAGKTSTLIERIFCLLTQPPRISVDELLVVTFTRAAAEEMKGRLVRRLQNELLRDDLAADLRAHIEEQIYHIPRANISTIHSFFLDVISAFPEQVGLAPGFDLMSEEETRLFQRDFLRAQLEDSLELEDETAGVLKVLQDQHKLLAGPEQIVQSELGLIRFLESLPDPDQFVALASRVYTMDDPMQQPEFRAAMDGHVLEKLAQAEDALRQLLPYFDPERMLSPAYSQGWGELDDLLGEIAKWRNGQPTNRDLDSIIDKLKVPDITGRVLEAHKTDDDRLYMDERQSVRDRLKKIQEGLEPFRPGALAQTLASSNAVLRVMLEQVALPWSKALLAEHLRMRRLTFAHLERLALRLLITGDGAPSAVALTYRERFRHILVDEFQDVNQLQYRLIRAVARPATATEGGNLFIVGDAKQSIYEFRLADPDLFLGLHRAARDLAAAPDGADARLNLVENFRSEALLLDAFNQIFSALLREKTIGLSYSRGHQFVHGGGSPGAQPAALELDVYTSSAAEQQDPEAEGEPMDAIEREAAMVANRVAAIGEPWSDICILLRSTPVAPALVKALEARAIPVFCDARRGFLVAAEVAEFQSLLQAIHNPYEDLALLGALRGPAARWTSEQLLLLRTVNRDAPFYTNLRLAADDTGHELHEPAREFMDRLTRWQRESTRNPMAELFSIIFDDLHLLEGVYTRPGGDQRRLNLLHMQEQARAFDSFLRKGLGAFLAFLQDLIDNDQDFAPPSPLAANANVVRIMTIHQSKGTEFPVVLVPFLGRKFNTMDLSASFICDRDLGVATRFLDVAPEGKADPPPWYDVLRGRRRLRNMAAELRLFYVALTRAKRAVYLSGTLPKAGQKLPTLLATEEMQEAIKGALSPLEWAILGLAKPVGPIPPREGASIQVGIVRLGLTNVEGPQPAVPQTPADETPHAATHCAAMAEAEQRIAAQAGLVARERLRAKISVSEIKRAHDQTRDPETPRYRPPVREQSPAFPWFPSHPVVAAARPTGAARGTTIHRFLALCEMEALDRRRLSEERDRLVNAGLLGRDEATSFRLEPIARLLNSTLGRRIRENGGRLFRERAFTVGIAPADLGHPEIPGPVLLQGVVDLLFQDEGKWVLVDYKTDFCGEDGARVDALVDVYTPQINLYRHMAESVLGVAIAECWLAFISGGTNVAVPRVENLAQSVNRLVEQGAVVFGEAEGRQRTVIRV